MTLEENIEGLKRNLNKLEERLYELDRTWAESGNNCCPSCFWGNVYSDVEDKITRRQTMLSVFQCRAKGQRPGKYRLVRAKEPCSCRGGHTTIASSGRCACGEPDCPGRGVCHVCKGTMRKWGLKVVITRKWPKISARNDENEE